MSVEMPLNEDHEVLGSEFCSGYSDALGRWNPGFYCPPREDASDALFCCGGASYKYCCTQRELAAGEELGNLPLILGAALGATAALAIIILVSCCCCSCCALYKSRSSPKQTNNGPVYRMQTSSTASGVANMYSFSNQNSLATTPIDTAASQIMVELEAGAGSRTGTMGRGNTFSASGASGARTLQRNGSHDPPPPYDASKSHHTLPHQRHHHNQHHQHQQQQHQQQQQQQYSTGDSPPQARQHFTLPRSHGGSAQQAAQQAQQAAQQAAQGARSPITTFPQGGQPSTFAPHPTATLSRVPRGLQGAAPAHHAVPVPVVRPPPGPLPPGPLPPGGPGGPTSPTQLRSPVDSPHRGFQTHTRQQMGPPGQQMGPPGQQMGPPPGQQMGPAGQMVGHPNQQMGPPVQQMGHPNQQMIAPGQQMGQLAQGGGPPKGVPVGVPGAPAMATTNGGAVPVNPSELSPSDTLYRSTKF
ncbi:Protein shisa-2-like protein [Frankliniella fusca]|uniref:Protein shisa-2-like protein n=1 Tax=Frankliniella fusca TaxID=407009 RepID=A0AAE1H465_9NEOP|nr:Protein shisa-2-like protein [Frankliniella fusca]